MPDAFAGRFCSAAWPSPTTSPTRFCSSASDAARMVTGIALYVDGGVLIGNDIPYEDSFARTK